MYSEYTVSERAVATVTVSWRLYDMYSEYTVSERAVASTVSWRLYDMYSEYTVSVATVADCFVCTICIRSIQLLKEQ